MNNSLDADKYHIPNLGKACGVLELISDFQGNCTLKEIAARLYPVEAFMLSCSF